VLVTKSNIVALLLSGIGLIGALLWVADQVRLNCGVSQELAAQMFVQESLRHPLAAFRQDMGRYPSTAEGLKALVEHPAAEAERWRGPYLQEPRVPLDPWSRPYHYAFPGRGAARPYDIWSLGPDVANAADDIGNWK
jgi:general secretion pathway protein G